MNRTREGLDFYDGVISIRVPIDAKSKGDFDKFAENAAFRGAKVKVVSVFAIALLLYIF